MTETFINDIRAALYGSMPDEQLERVMRTVSTVAADYTIERASTDLTIWQQSLPECYKAFMVTRKIEGLSPLTLDLYRQHLERFFANVYKPVQKITANDIRVYLYKLQEERGMSNRTLDSHRSTLSAFFSWASANEYLERNPCASVKPIKYEERPREPLTATELELVRDACQTTRERAIVEILYSTACRVSELTILKLSDINMSTGEVELFGKGSKYRTSFLSECALLYLQKYLSERSDNCPSVIVSTRAPHKGITKESIEKIIKEIGARCGIERLHPHLFRHSSATNLLQRGMEVTQLRELLGHSSVDTTMIYAHTDKRSIKENHRKYIN